MAPKAAYAHQKLTAVPQKSAVDARAQFTDGSADHTLSCEPVFEAGGISLHRNTLVVFKWRLHGGTSCDEVAEVTARCNHVCERGVPLPEHWKTALRCLSLAQIVDQTVCTVRSTDPRLSDLSCYVAGAPKSKTPFPERTGKLVPLNIEGQRMMFILCARIQEDIWLVHKGSRHQDTALLHEGDPLKDLERHDVSAEAWNTVERQRLKSTPEMNHLRALVGSNDERWRRLVAVARFQALCTADENTLRDPAAALLDFESNPFKWEGPEDRRSHVCLDFLWVWADVCAGYQHAFVNARLDNLLQRKQVPCPKGMCKHDIFYIIINQRS